MNVAFSITTPFRVFISGSTKDDGRVGDINQLASLGIP